MSTISTTINTGITLGASGSYASPLTITATGAVEPPSGFAVFGPNTQPWTVVNEGIVAASGGLIAGIALNAGGIVTNTASGLITATGSDVSAIDLSSGGIVLNSGLITAYGTNDAGIFAYRANATVANTGTIRAYGAGNVFGVQLGSGNVYNSGLISGNAFGVDISFGYAAVVNSGTIDQISGGGVALDFDAPHGSVFNSGLIAAYGGNDNGVFAFIGTVVNTGTIRAGNVGFVFGVVMTSGSVNNSGLISGTSDGVRVADVATIVNSGTISQMGITGFEAIYLGGGGTIIDSGMISAASGRAITFGGANASLLLLESGFELAGSVVGSNTAGATNALELGGNVGAPLTVDYNRLGLNDFQDLMFGPGGSNLLLVSNTTGTLPLTISGFAAPSDEIDLTQIGSNGTIAGGSANAVTIAGANGTVTLPFDASDLPVDLATRSDGTGGTELIVRPPPRDFNGDGRSDVLWQDGSGNVAVWELGGLAIVGSGVVGSANPSNWAIRGTGDFNGDGKSDILWQDTAGDVAAWEMNGLTVAASAIVEPDIPANWTIRGTGDFNGDGMSDILWQDTAGDVAMWEMNGETVIGNGEVATVPSNWHIVGTGDFDGDGRSDILWQDTDGDVAVWEMNGGAIDADALVATAPSNWHITGTGDFNGDGKSDILWQDAAGDVSIWEMNGLSVAASAIVGFADPSTWRIAGIGDYNGDGMSDILWRDNGGDVALWAMIGPNVAASGFVGSADPTTWHIVPPDNTGDITAVPAAAGALALPAPVTAGSSRVAQRF